MKLVIATVLFFLGFAQICRGQTNGTTNPVNSQESAAAFSTNSYAVLGATPQQEALGRSQIQAMQPDALPLRIVFLPHWKYVDTARIFLLHVPAGFTSALFTHLPSRTVFIDADRYVSDESLGYWLAHEVGHLATNSVKEDDAERAARKYRKRLEDASKRAALKQLQSAR